MQTAITRRTALTSLALGTASLAFASTAARAATPAYDLEPVLTVSSWKAEGYAGLVALRLKNVGADRYYGDFPVVSFRIDVKTASGPTSVDRLITPGWFNGAYTRDLGFDAATSTRSFLVTLANPIKAGETQLVANLNFGDGLTSEGRLYNYVTVTQVGRIAGDTSTGNDQNRDSRKITLTDTGRKASGIF